MLLPYSAIIAQDLQNTLLSPVIKSYNEFISYTPKALRNKYIPESFGTLQLDNIISLSVGNRLLAYHVFNDKDRAWLYDRVNNLAVAFYIEGKPVIINITGGYYGCLDKEYELMRKIINHTEVTIVNFCHSCSGADSFEKEFIAVFNNRTYSLISAKKL